MIDVALPPRLRNNERARKLVAADIAEDASTFATLYDAYEDRPDTEEVSVQIARAKAGNRDALAFLFQQFLNRATATDEAILTDADAEKWLADSRNPHHRDPGAPDKLYDHFEKRKNRLRKATLYPPVHTAFTTAVTQSPTDSTALSEGGDASVEPATRADVHVPAVLTTEEAEGQWADLQDDIRAAAERLWRDLFLRETDETARQYRMAGSARTTRSAQQMGTQAKIEGLQWVVRRVRRLMLLWLEVSLYRIRAYSNFVGARMEGRDSRSGGGTRRLIGAEVRKYRATMQAWDKDLQSITHQAVFQTGALDSQQFRALTKQFGSAEDAEQGWNAQAVEARAELRFQLWDELRREHARAGRGLPAAAYWLLKVTTGYGTRPMFFLRSTGVVIGVAMLLFFLDDLLHPILNDPLHPAKEFGAFFCPPDFHPTVSHWYDVFGYIVRYFYLAITNLSSLGSNSDLARYCGGVSTQILLACTAIAGYFLLALLAALFFQLLTQAE